MDRSLEPYPTHDPYDIGYQTIIAAAQAMSGRSGTGGFVEKNVLLERK